MGKIELLYDKIMPIWTDYVNELQKTAPNAWRQAYEFVIKGDIVEALEEMTGNDWDEYFGDEALDKLLSYDDPLNVIFEAWYSVETEHLEHIREALQRAGTGNYRRIFVSKGD